MPASPWHADSPIAGLSRPALELGRIESKAFADSGDAWNQLESVRTRVIDDDATRMNLEHKGASELIVPILRLQRTLERSHVRLADGRVSGLSNERARNVFELEAVPLPLRWRVEVGRPFPEQKIVAHLNVPNAVVKPCRRRRLE